MQLDRRAGEGARNSSSVRMRKSVSFFVKTDSRAERPPPRRLREAIPRTRIETVVTPVEVVTDGAAVLDWNGPLVLDGEVECICAHRAGAAQ